MCHAYSATPRAAVVQVMEQLLEFRAQAGQRTQVLLQPSTRDVHHAAVFPQPPMTCPPGTLHSGITMLPNPGTFRCNEVVIASCTTDVLRHLGGQTAHRGAAGDRLAGLASDLLGQRR